jgi:hypothetical protein
VLFGEDVEVNDSLGHYVQHLFWVNAPHLYLGLEVPQVYLCDTHVEYKVGDHFYTILVPVFALVLDPEYILLDHYQWP